MIDVDLNNGNITLTDSGREYINNPNFIRAANIDKARSAIRAMEIQHGLENDTIRYGITLEGTDRDLQFFRFASNLDLEEITLSPDKKAALQVMENISKWEKTGLCSTILTTQAYHLQSSVRKSYTVIWQTVLI